MVQVFLPLIDRGRRATTALAGIRCPRTRYNLRPLEALPDALPDVVR